MFDGVSNFRRDRRGAKLKLPLKLHISSKFLVIQQI